MKLSLDIPTFPAEVLALSQKYGILTEEQVRAPERLTFRDAIALAAFDDVIRSGAYKYALDASMDLWTPAALHHNAFLWELENKTIGIGLFFGRYTGDHELPSWRFMNIFCQTNSDLMLINGFYQMPLRKQGTIWPLDQIQNAVQAALKNPNNK